MRTPKYPEQADVVLVHPRGSNWMPGETDVTAAANMMPPLGLCSIASVLEKQGIKVAVLDFFAYPASMERCRDNILSRNPDIVGFSCTTSSFPEAYDAAAALKNKTPGVKTVFGGVHVSALKERILRDFPAVDCVVVGEGENTMTELASGRHPSEIKGLIYRDDKGPVFNGYPDLIENIDVLPFPAYRKLKGFPRKYTLPVFNYPRSPNGTMISSRGCPYSCSYCDRSVFKSSFRFHSTEYIYEHMKFLKKNYRMKHINFYDDLFTFDRQRIVELCRRLIAKPLGMTFNCAARLGHLDRPLTALLKKAGCWMISLGIESGDPKLASLHKSGPNDLDKMKITVRMIKESGIRVKGLFIMGLPGETEQTVKTTMNYVHSLELDDMNLAKFTPFPGAPVYPSVKRYGKFDEELKKMNCMNFVFLPHDIPDKERLEFLYKKFIRSFYESPRMKKQYVKMLWQSPHSYFVLLKNLPKFLKAFFRFRS